MNRILRPTLPLAAAALLLSLAFFLAAAWTPLAAHAVVYPAEAPTGAYQKYVLRVPNERNVSTTRVEITFPEGVRVISFDEVPGWRLETTAAEGGIRFVRAVWTGDLAPGRFVEFGFIGVNPQEETELKWDVIQTYEENDPVAWTGPTDSATPASRTRIRAASAAGSVGAFGGASRSGWLTPGAVMAGAALLLALISLGIVIRPREDGPR